MTGRLACVSAYAHACSFHCPEGHHSGFVPGNELKAFPKPGVSAVLFWRVISCMLCVLGAINSSF